MAKRPRISVTERGVQNAAILDSDPRYRKGISSPFGIASEAIQLKEPGWYCRWVNAGIIQDKVWRAKNVGYDNVRPSDLADAEQLGQFQTDAAGCIVRGERGREVLLKIPMVVHAERQRAKTEKNLRDMKDYDRQKANMLEAAAAQYGAQAADYLADESGPFGKITDKYERIEVAEESAE